MKIILSYNVEMTWNVQLPSNWLEVAKERPIVLDVFEYEDGGVQIEASLKGEPHWKGDAIGYFGSYSAAYEAAKAYVEKIGPEQYPGIHFELKAKAPKSSGRSTQSRHCHQTFTLTSYKILPGAK
jgi:hypothetical protein